MRAIAIGMITAVFCMSAQATLIVAEPDDFALGAELTSAFSGVTLSVEGKPSSVVRAVDGFSAFNSGNIASTGSLVFGQDPYRVIDPADCSNKAQKTTVDKIRIINTTVRANSGEL